MKKHILFVAPELPIGGAEKFLVALANSLIQHGFMVTLVSLNKNNPVLPEFDKNIDFFCFSRRYKFDPMPVYRLRKLITKQKFDYVFCINFFSFFILTCATIFLSVPKIISLHTTIASGKKEHWLITLYTKMIGKRDTIITVSGNQAQYISGMYKIPLTKFTTIYNGIDTSHWTLPPPGFDIQQARSAYNIPANAAIIIITAGLRAEKNHVAAIKALKILQAAYDEQPYLLLVGDGPMKNKIQKVINGLNLTAHVKFAGWQQDPRPFYWMSDLFTLCSDKVETFSIAALEAMACGLPCVLTDIGGASELIMENKNGFLSNTTAADIAAKWHQVLTENFQKTTVRQTIENNFNQARMVNAYLDYFRKYDLIIKSDKKEKQKIATSPGSPLISPDKSFPVNR